MQSTLLTSPPGSAWRSLLVAPHLNATFHRNWLKSGYFVIELLAAAFRSWKSKPTFTPPTFSRRIENLCGAARGYFAKHPSQILEAKYDNLIRQVCGWSNRRADIAHGIVQFAHYQPRYREQYLDEGKSRYVLVPAFYTIIGFIETE